MFGLISAQLAFFLSLGAFLAGAAGSLVFWKNNKAANLWSNILAIIGSLFGLVASLSVILTGAVFSYANSSGSPLMDISLDVDRLAAFFIFVISLIALLASVYGIEYVKHFYKKYNIGALGFFYNTFILGMLLVVAAHNAIFFLVAWEIMSLASYFLVIFENKEKENVRAGSLYFVMTHVGTAFILLSFLCRRRSAKSTCPAA